MDSLPSTSRLIRALGREALDRLHVLRAMRNVESRNPILVYQMGKVGSSTVIATLEAIDLEAPVLHLHRLNPAKLQRATEKQRRSITPWLPEHLLIGHALRKKLDRGNLPCRIITLTRDPWARVISHLFEDRRKKMPMAIRPDGTVDIDKAQQTLDAIVGAGSPALIDPSAWFDLEIREQFGIDVYDTPYDFERGYVHIEHPEHPVLVTRLEDLDRALPAALADFLGVEEHSITVTKANEGSSKRYATSLSAAKKAFRPDPALIRRLSETRYFQHFYAADPPSWYRDAHE